MTPSAAQQAADARARAIATHRRAISLQALAVSFFEEGGELTRAHAARDRGVRAEELLRLALIEQGDQAASRE